jgi:methylmalonyl-CoA mutase N-terminal domain/subunit
MTVQQPLNNLIRNTIDALSMILSGVNGTQIDAFDEALGEPTEEAVVLSLRTQQIIQHETGIIDVSDPLGGSYYLEWLTNEVEKAAWDIVDKIEKMSGWIKADEKGWPKSQIEESAYKWRHQVETGEKVWVGVNKYVSDIKQDVKIWPVDPEVEKIAVEEIKKHRAERNNEETQAALKALKDEAIRIERSDVGGELMDRIVDAARKDATAGEIQSILREVFGNI